MAGIADIGTSLYVNPARRGEFARQIQTCGYVSDFESEVFCRDGTRIWISENAHAVRGSEGEFLYYEGTVETSPSVVSTRPSLNTRRLTMR